jgi:hypothetical protein
MLMVTNLHRVLSRDPMGRRHRRHAIVGAVSGLLAIGLLSGCQGADSSASPTTTASAAASTPASAVPSPTSTGIAALSADEILAKAREASTSVKTVHLRGAFGEGDSTYEMDTKLVRGKGGTGHVKLGDLRIDLTVIGKAAYLKGDKAFYTSVAGKEAASLLAGKYLKTSSTEPGFKDFVSLVNFNDMFDELLKPTGTITVGDASEINGIPVIALESSDKSKLYVATEGEPYIVRISSPCGDAQHLDFLEYNKAVPLKAPPAGQIVDVSKMG